ncbi:MAG: MCE family protein [Nitrospirae bacterium]|nr:MCE family protein [Nitrospirota bacterium]
MRLSAEARVGLVILLGALILSYMTFTVGGYRFGREAGYRLYALFDTVAGLDTKSGIRVAGVGVGKVETIALQDGQAKVALRIKPEVKLRKGTQAAVRATGLLGEKYIELIPGTGEGFLQDGDTMAESERVADLDRLINQFSTVAADIKTVSASLREALGTEEGKQSLKEIVANIRELSRNLNVAVKDNRENFTKAVANIQEASASLKEDLPKLLESLKHTSEKLDVIATKVEKGEGTLGKLVQEEGVYNKLDSALEGLNSVTKKLEKGEGTIGKLFTDEKAYDQITTTLEGLSNAVSHLERFKTVIGFRNEYQFDSEKNKGYFSLQLQPREDKFYLLELVDDPRGRVTSTTTQVVGVTGAVTELKTDRQLKINAEFGRRFSDVALRIGLMENTFGLGTDLYLFNDALRFSADAWDFNSNDPLNKHVHLKGTASYSFFKYLFVQGGYDNLINKKLGTGFAGGGIRFEDDDLKYLVGSGALRMK